MVHRDVACRNILLYENDKIAKIADFGLCCNCNESETYYATSHKKLPLKWVSIEALCDRKFSEKSDVWAFGILCYEMFSLGAEPYPTFTHAEMFEFLQSGKRLAKPKDSTDEIYQLMLDCWKENPADRFCFAEIVEILRKMLESQTAEYGYVPLDDYYKE
uniref:Protein kinase domain-containing protein n=1 Tax=Panagrolaimus davidi TaxID=227884 RepID=A0A914PHE7_9BILA